MKKKIIFGVGIVAILVVLLFTLTGCGEKESSKEETKTNAEEKINNKTENESKTNKEIEDDAFHSNYGELTKYDSEVFYAKDRKITYKVPTGFETEKKELSSTMSYEAYQLKNGNKKVYLDIELRNADLYDDYFKVYEGKDGLNDPAEGLLASNKKFANMKSEGFENKEAGFTEDKIVKVGEYKVYYTTYDANTLGEDGADTVNIIATFAVDEDYLISIEMWAFATNADSDKVSFDGIKSLIESFKVEKY